MPGDVLIRGPKLTLEEFHAFRDGRPKEEKWELIDGVPVMMPPPTLVHQRIAKNLERMLDARLSVVRPEWRADREIGVLLSGDEKYNPEPDVTIIDREIAIGQLYATRFYGVAEVLSGGSRPEQVAGADKPHVLAAKLGYCKLHEHCRSVLFVRQDRIEADLHRRDADAWSVVKLSEPEARIVLPELGDIGPLGDLYRDTPLWRAPAAG